jgi:type II secretory pathway component PulF
VLIPSMADIYGDFGAELPWITRTLMNMSSFFLSYWWAILVVIAYCLDLVVLIITIT